MESALTMAAARGERPDRPLSAPKAEKNEKAP
jgi:hypothetical protein